MAIKMFVAAFLVDEDQYGDQVDAQCIAEYLVNNVAGNDGLSSFIVWASPDDFIADHKEHGPISIAHLMEAADNG